MNTRQAIRDLSIEVSGKAMPKAVEDQKVSYIEGGGSWKQLYHDLLEFSNNYRSLPRLVDDAYTAAGYDPGAQVKSDKVGALAGGFNYAVLLTEIFPKQNTGISQSLKDALNKLTSVWKGA